MHSGNETCPCGIEPFQEEQDALLGAGIPQSPSIRYVLHTIEISKEAYT